MKNIQVFNGAANSDFDIFAATEEEFLLIFPEGQDDKVEQVCASRTRTRTSVSRTFSVNAPENQGGAPEETHRR
jgi:hypothetical protein